jgi:hypothetical protein
MKYTELLEEVLASDGGWYCIVGIKPLHRTIQKLVETLEEANDEVHELVTKGYNVYYGCAKYATNKNRQKPNVLNVKASWMDLDCGEGKSFETQESAIDELAIFCNKIGLPPPNLVDSGYGVHCYWIYTQHVTKEEWKPVAERLKQLCSENEFKADPSVTADEARILRVTETFNFKNDVPRKVQRILQAPPVDFNTFKDILGVTAPVGIIRAENRELSPLMKAIQDNEQYRFSTILEKSAAGAGCNQLLSIAVEQAVTPEPLWRAGLSIARNCVDWEVAVHAISDQHPDYDPAKTEEKAERTLDKPYSCVAFEAQNPEGCKKCKVKTKISTPIKLGLEILALEDSTITQVDEELGIVTTYKFPEIPYPFFRGKNGGIYKENKEDEPSFVYENDLYLVKRMNDRGRGELVLARLHLPKDKPVEFVIPLASLNSRDDLRKLLAANGCICMPAALDNIMLYLVSCTKSLQRIKDAEVLRQQMGWADNDTKFIMGEKEISAEGISYSPPSEATASVVKWIHEKGSLPVWSNIANVYNRPGLEANAFTFLTAFGSMLIKHTHYRGAFINIISRHSGTGKTTVQRMINSVVGHPHELLSKESDTLAHKMFRMGVLCNFCYTADELSNSKPEVASNLIYGTTAGQGPGRMQSQSNMERKNDTTWATIGVGSSNSSLVELLTSFKTAANGELMRLLEYQIAPSSILSKAEAYQLFEIELNENYGLAGPIFAEWVVTHLEETKELIREVQDFIDKRANFVNKDRYHSVVIACNIAGGLIACQLKLIDYDIPRILEWVFATLIEELRVSASDQNIAYSDFLGQFMNQNIGSALIINNAVDQKTGMNMAPLMEPRNQLNLRIEPDTKFVYISAKSFREYCVEHKVICKDMLATLKDQNIYLGEEKKRLGKGTKMVSSPPVNAYKFYYDYQVGEDSNENSHD